MNRKQFFLGRVARITRRFTHWSDWAASVVNTRPLRRSRRATTILWLILAIGVVGSNGLATQAFASDPATANAAVARLRSVQTEIQGNLPTLEQATVCLQAGGGSGSGIIVSADGLILTAAHVVADAKQVTARFIDDQAVECKVLGSYGPADAAMVKIIDPGQYPFAEMAPPDSLSVGDTLFALGHPGGFDRQRGLPLRIGHVVSMESNFFASDASLIGGDSGGPSFNLLGQVVGIHSNITSSLSVNNDVRIGVFHEHWDSLLAGERRGKILQPENASEELVVGLKLLAGRSGEAIVIDRVVAQTPADWAMLKPGDQIIRVNDRPVTSPAWFLQSAKSGKLGKTIDLLVRRNESNTSSDEDDGTSDDETSPGDQISLSLELMTYDQVTKKRQTATEESTESREPPAQPRPPGDTAGAFAGKGQSDASKQSKSDRLTSQSKKQSAKTQRSQLARLLEKSRQNGGRLKIDRQKLLELSARLSSRVDRMSSKGNRKKDDWHSDFRKAFAAAADQYAGSLYPVWITGRTAAIAVAVSPQGHFVTKASEIEGRQIEIIAEDRLRLDARCLAIDRQNDLALIKTDRPPTGVRPVDFQKTQSGEVTKGMIVGSLGVSSEPLVGFGVVSVPARSLTGESGAFLGVDVDIVDSELTVTRVAPGGPADRGGIKVGDVIKTFGGKTVASPDEFAAEFAMRLPDQRVRIDVMRGADQLSILVTLGDRSMQVPTAGKREQGIDKVTTRLSRRRWSFTEGIQHDGAIRPRDCGGLLLNLYGQIVGLNIARAGRIKSYSLPASLIDSFVRREMQKELVQ